MHRQKAGCVIQTLKIIIIVKVWMIFSREADKKSDNSNFTLYSILSSHQSGSMEILFIVYM